MNRQEVIIDAAKDITSKDSHPLETISAIKLEYQFNLCSRLNFMKDNNINFRVFTARITASL